MAGTWTQAAAGTRSMAEPQALATSVSVDLLVMMDTTSDGVRSGGWTPSTGYEYLRGPPQPAIECVHAAKQGIFMWGMGVLAGTTTVGERQARAAGGRNEQA